MVQDLFLWSLKVSLLLTLTYGAYWLLFKNNTHFQLRRLVIIGCLTIVALIPFIEIELEVPWSNPIEETIESIAWETDNTINSSATISTETETKLIIADNFSWNRPLLNLYITGVVLALGLFLFEIFKLSIWYYYGARRTDIQDNVITHKGIKYPFSFWKWIFIPQGTDYDQDIWEIIEKHETAHLNQYHTFDMVFVNLIQCLLWYNPMVYIIQKELKENHEALADQSVLNTTDFKTYAQALVKVSINSSALKLGHSFALISTLSKRITAMQKQKTTMKKTLFSVFTLLIIASTTIGANVLKAQHTEENKQEALAAIKKRKGTFSFIYFHKLTEKHQDVLKRLKEVYPDKEIKHSYSQSPEGFEYLKRYEVDRAPLFYDKLSDNDKVQLSNLVQKDTVRFGGYFLKSGRDSWFSFPMKEFKDEINTAVEKNANYIVFYEPINKASKEIFDISEVDLKPEPAGGIDSFVKAIALAMDVPNNVNKKDLPATIDFEVVIDGGRNFSEMHLITELEGTDEENKELYLFFGDVYRTLTRKVNEFYVWKPGVKDGKEVRVRTTIAIPTKYM